MIVSSRVILVNGLASAFAKILAIATMVWVQQYLIKNVSVDEYALLPVIYSLMIFMPIFTETLTGGIRRYVAGAYAEGDLSRVTIVVSSIFPVLILASMIMVALGYFISKHINLIININSAYLDEAKIIVFLLFLGEAIRMLSKGFGSGAFVRQKLAAESFISVVFEIVRCIAVIFVLLKLGVGILNYVITGFVVGMFEILAITAFSVRVLPEQKLDISKFNPALIKKLLNFGGWSSLYGTMGMVRKSADPVILNRFSTSLDVACFNIGALVPNRVEALVNQSFMGSLSPQVIALSVAGDVNRLRRLYLSVGRYLLFGVLFMVAPLIVFKSHVVSLYVGSEYYLAGQVLVLLLMSFPLVFGNFMVLILANAKDKMRELAIRESFTSILNLCLTLFLVVVLDLGALGSALATLICFGMLSLFTHWPFAMKMVGATWMDVGRSIFLPTIVPFILFLSALILVEFCFNIDSWFDLFLAGAIASPFYMFSVWWAAVDDDRILMARILKKLFSFIK